MSNDLAAFLLARIAEDERLAHDAESVWQVIGRNVKPFPGVAHHPDDWMKSEAFSLNINPMRFLAECEAKRRIIAWVTDETVICEVADPVLVALALPYAGHPDYREEWRS